MQLSELELQLADGKFRLQGFRLETRDIAFDACLLAFDLDVGWLTRKAGLGQLLIVRDQLLIELPLSQLKIDLLLKRRNLGIQTWKLLLESFGFLLLGLSFLQECALLAVAHLGEAGRINGKTNHVRESDSIIAVLLRG